MENKVVDQFSKRKLSQRKVLEQIKDVEQGRKIEKIALEKIDDKKRNLEVFKTPKRPKKKEEPEVEVMQCKICKLGVQLTCPICKEAIILCERYKNPSLRPSDSLACEMYKERY